MQQKIHQSIPINLTKTLHFLSIFPFFLFPTIWYLSCNHFLILFPFLYLPFILPLVLILSSVFFTCAPLFILSFECWLLLGHSPLPLSIFFPSYLPLPPIFLISTLQWHLSYVSSSEIPLARSNNITNLYLSLFVFSLYVYPVCSFPPSSLPPSSFSYLTIRRGFFFQYDSPVVWV